MKILRHLSIAGVLLLCGCDITTTPSPAQRPIPIATLFPTAAQPAPTLPNATPAPDTGWLAGRPGVEMRRIDAQQDGKSAPLVIVRVDPAAVHLRVAYAPDEPRSLRSWFSQSNPILAINGGFFTEEYRTTALLVSDGAPTGESYAGFGGMLAVAPDGSVSIRPLRDETYDPAEPLDQALQSFPMLIFPGNIPAEIEDNGERSRRSALALDQSGRLLIIAAPSAGWTLRGLAAWLSQSDLAIDRALNLDGGSSTGLYLKDGALEETIDSFGPLPTVLLVEAK